MIDLPAFDVAVEDTERLLRDSYGLTGRLKPLGSQQDAKVALTTSVEVVAARQVSSLSAFDHPAATRTLQRAATLVVSGQQQATINPANDYATTALEREWQILAVADSVPLEVMQAAVLRATGRAEPLWPAIDGGLLLPDLDESETAAASVARHGGHRPPARPRADRPVRADAHVGSGSRAAISDRAPDGCPVALILAGVVPTGEERVVDRGRGHRLDGTGAVVGANVLGRRGAAAVGSPELGAAWLDETLTHGW